MRLFFFILIIISIKVYAQEVVLLTDNDITTGARQTEKYIPLLSGKNVGVIANPTSVIGKRHLIDTLLSLKVNIKKYFLPNMDLEGNRMQVKK